MLIIIAIHIITVFVLLWHIENYATLEDFWHYAPKVVTRGITPIFFLSAIIEIIYIALY